MDSANVNCISTEVPSATGGLMNAPASSSRPSAHRPGSTSPRPSRSSSWACAASFCSPRSTSACSALGPVADAEGGEDRRLEARVGQLLAGTPQRFQAAIDKAMLQEGQFLRTKIVEGIREQAPGGRAFAPLAPTTLAIRRFRGFGGTKALIAGGDLRNSITVTREGDQVFVGVHRTAKTRTGQSLVDIAALHEHGSRPIVMKLTPKARAFLHAAFRKADLDAPHGGQPSSRGGTWITAIPAVPHSRARAVRETRGGLAAAPHARREAPGW